MNWLETADWVAPYLALGHSIGRIGCFLVGDCYGKACDLPWAMSFPNGIPPTLEHVHPTQLYESLFGFLIFSEYARICPSLIGQVVSVGVSGFAASFVFGGLFV